MKLQEIQEKLSGALEGVDEKTRYGILAGILLSVFLMDYFLLMRPQLNVMNKISPEIRLLQEDLQTAKNDIQRQEDYKKQVKELNKKLLVVNNRVRPRDAVPLILERLSRIANSNDVKLDQIMPQTQDIHPLMENNQRSYYALPISIRAQGGYHNFGRFLNEVEMDEILLRLDVFSISASPSLSKEHNIHVTLDAIVYEQLKP